MDFRKFKEFDWKLLAIVVLIFSIGIVILSSATHANVTGINKQIKVQIVSFLVGLVIIFALLLIDYNVFSKYSKQIYIANIILLLIVYIPGLGVSMGGARSWIHLGPVYLQTSELVKIGFVLCFAKFLEDKKGKFNTFKDLIPVAVYVSPVLFLILMQPDLGGVIVFLSIIMGMVFVCDINLKIIIYSAIGAIASIPAAYPFLKPHQKIRLEAFLNPGNPEYAGNYQVIQSMIAIGSGKIFGKGLYKGTQNQFNFLPVQDSDFIFAVLVEELGLLGGIILIILFYMFLKRLLSIAKASKDFYGSLITVGILFMFFYQVIQNIGMTMGIMPVTGVTLPFVSYGGSSIVNSMIALGLVFNVAMRRKKINF